MGTENHLAWFVIDAVGVMDLQCFYVAYRADGHGRPAYEPAMVQDGAERQPRDVGGGTEQGTEGKELAGARGVRGGSGGAGRCGAAEVAGRRGGEGRGGAAVDRAVQVRYGGLVAARFEVSWQRANARLRRLERVGLVAGEQQHVCEARAVFITGRVGCRSTACAAAGGPTRARAADRGFGRCFGTQSLGRRGLHRAPVPAARAGGARGVQHRGQRRGQTERRHWPDAVIEPPWRARVNIEVELLAKAL